LASFRISKEMEKWQDGWKTTKRSVKEGQLIQKTIMICGVITPT
jgi:hypothetical protein